MFSWYDVLGNIFELSTAISLFEIIKLIITPLIIGLVVGLVSSYLVARFFIKKAAKLELEDIFMKFLFDVLMPKIQKMTRKIDAEFVSLNKFGFQYTDSEFELELKSFLDEYSELFRNECLEYMRNKFEFKQSKFKWLFTDKQFHELRSAYIDLVYRSFDFKWCGTEFGRRSFYQFVIIEMYKLICTNNYRLKKKTVKSLIDQASTEMKKLDYSKTSKDYLTFVNQFEGNLRSIVASSMLNVVRITQRKIHVLQLEDLDGIDDLTGWIEINVLKEINPSRPQNNIRYGFQEWVRQHIQSEWCIGEKGKYYFSNRQEAIHFYTVLKAYWRNQK